MRELATALALATSIACGWAHAATVTWYFGGTLTSVSSDLSGSFAVGDAVSGSVAFDPAAPNTSPSPLYGTYPAISGFTVTVGGLTYDLPAAEMPGEVYVLDEAGGDVLQFQASLAGPAVAGLAPRTAFLVLADSTGAALSGVSLPAVPPALAAFDTRYVSIAFETQPKRTPTIEARLSALSLTPVPEPASALAVLFGLAALLAVAARRRAA